MHMAPSDPRDGRSPSSSSTRLPVHPPAPRARETTIVRVPPATRPPVAVGAGVRIARLALGVAPRPDATPIPRRAPPVSAGALPAPVLDALWRHVDSVVKLEVLRHARLAEVSWTTSDLAAALEVDEPDVGAAVAGLCQAGLLRCDGQAYHRTPAAAPVTAAVDVLYRAHGFDPARVQAAIDALARASRPRG